MEMEGKSLRLTAPTAKPQEVIDGIFSLFDPSLPVHLLKGEETGLDIHQFVEHVHQATGWRPSLISPADLRLMPCLSSVTGHTLYCEAGKSEDGVERLEPVHQIGLELQQDELRSLPRAMLKEIALRCFNDLRTIFLVHDKRMLGIVLQELDSLVHKHGLFGPAQAETLRRSITPTILPGSRGMAAMIHFSRYSPHIREDFLLKPIRGGKGTGIFFGSDMTAEQWISELELLRQAELTTGRAQYVVQRRIEQPRFDVLLEEAEKGQQYYLVGTYMAIHGRYLGLGLWRTSSAREILAVAHIHPFYSPNSKYPPTPSEISRVRQSPAEGAEAALATFPLLRKDDLYEVIERLCADESPQNTYRLSSYISVTGGGSGKSVPMVFLTDLEENYQQRVATSFLMRECKMVEPSDWVLNVHPGGNLYRALDLSTQTIELAGGNVLCAGHVMQHDKSVAACIRYHVNFLAGDAAMLVNFAHHVDSLGPDIRAKLHIKKIMYTSESMPQAKREYLVSVLGPISFFSSLGAAETGPWAVANLEWTKDIDDDGEDAHAATFFFDTRAMYVEVVPLSIDLKTARPDNLELLPEGKTGHLVLTSLQRLRNPLVRYVSGDVGSLHSLPPGVASRFDPELRSYLRILRLYGRDQRFSFKWLSDYYEVDKLNHVMQTPEWGILQWQVILADDPNMEGSDSFELRLLRRSSRDQEILTEDELLSCLHETFFLTFLTEKLFRAVFVTDVNEFERSETSGKVVRVIDRRK
ncbi:MAG: hypothetical protein Q9214_004932 [Letrouitia sp. 1 TL-2023]